LKDPLIWVRAIHFVATMMVMGGVIFRAFIGEPAFLAANSARLGARVRSPLAAMAWFGLAVTVLSGAAWLVLQAERMSELSLAEVFSQGAVWTVLSETDFGIDWGVRFALAGLLAAIWVRGDVLRPYYRRAGAVGVAAGLVGTLAWAGHAAASSGIEGAIHLTARGGGVVRIADPACAVVARGASPARGGLCRGGAAGGVALFAARRR
jgi:putative copper resistance protein D